MCFYGAALLGEAVFGGWCRSDYLYYNNANNLVLAGGRGCVLAVCLSVLSKPVVGNQNLPL